jgi:linoleoyl-CoA desaturase
MPSSRYQQIAPKVKVICERYGLPYNTGPFSKQFGSVQRTILRLAFPNGRPRRKPGPYRRPPEPVTPIASPNGKQAAGRQPAFP